MTKNLYMPSVLEAIYPNVAAWDAAMARVQAKTEGFKAEFEDVVCESPAKLWEVLRQFERILIEVESVFVYGQLGFDLNPDSDESAQRFARAEENSLYVEELTSFLLDELLQIDMAQFDAFTAEQPELVRYRPFLLRVNHAWTHGGAPELRSALAALDSVGQHFEESAKTLLLRELKFVPVEHPDNGTVTLTWSNYRTLLSDPDRAFRQRVAQSFLGGLHQHVETLSSLYHGYVKKEQQAANLRGFTSSFEAAMHRDQVEGELYDHLLEVARKHAPAFQASLELRRQRRGEAGDALRWYDLFAPLAPAVSRTYTLKDAEQVLTAALQPLGPEYVQYVRESFTHIVPDAPMPTVYTTNVYARRPVVLMNYRNTVDSLLTLAHELGHALHLRLANRRQPFFAAEASVIPSEIAALTNEWLVLLHLLDMATDEEERSYLTTLAVEKFQTAFFRQALLAEFERHVHDQIEEGAFLTAPLLGELYSTLLATYYGEEFAAAEAADDWVRVTNLYECFTTYTAPIASCIAVTLASSLHQEGGLPLADRYLQMLAKGNSLPPADLLQIIGVDLMQGDYYKQALEAYKSLF
ncbi:M3 family oligoendopeptidase [Tumebacillus permanentifrigoris]|uniref:Oligoendopeptidase F n=1 Tax=Tumebacillus permanentifrigoris TaxID=378543 RepID=A0A316DUX4_9BACL|nr:M3 family metallopeptidase [Tumebacillus permanentifrigoris]PWK12872.1 oligoendopeptidase F [Tumebacillus permanentifrigoris]